jgi:glycosyltransferase involved in cell wall biosynthesis
MISGEPIVILRDRIPAMEALLAKLVQESSFDVVHADQTAMAQYGLYARDAHLPNRRPYTVLDQHNALYLVVQRQSQYERKRLMRVMWQREADLLADYERQLMQEYDAILTVTHEDKRALASLLPEQAMADIDEKITAVPICVDPDVQALVMPVERGPRILHLGTMFWPPNIEGVLWFAKEILPIVLEAVPKATFIIAGKNPPLEILSLADGSSPFRDHIEVTGFVRDPTKLLASSRVFAVPLLAGGGMRVKILDAWLWGIPIVSTGIGAEGIDITAGENLLLADDAKAFAEAIVRILTDDALADRLRKNGRAQVEMAYDWRIIYQGVDVIYSSLATADTQ